MIVRWLQSLLHATLLMSVLTGVSGLRAEDWPQWRGPNRDGVWRETGIVKKFPSDRLPARWSVPVGPGYSGPTVAEGRVYVTDRVAEPTQQERVHCFDEQTGKTLWSYTYDCVYEEVGYTAGPRASVTVHDGRAYALGSMGYLHVFDAASGELLWHVRLNEQYKIEMPIWGIAASPLIYDGNVILHIGGKPNACIVALDIQTGKEVWRSMDDRASYSSPILIKQANQDVLAVWTGDHLAGLDPRTGKVHWKSEMPPSRMVIGIATPIVENNLLFVTSFYDGSKMMRFSSDQLTAEEVWREVGENEQQTKALHSIISTPILKDGYLYGVDSYGELRCLDAKTGKRIWEDQKATPRDRWSNIHLIQHEGQVWMFNEQGELLITELSPEGYRELSRTKLIEPTTDQLNRRGKGVTWAHPAFANRHVFIRSDRELLSASLAE